MSRFRPVWPNADSARSAANRFRTKAIIRSNCGRYSANCKSKVRVCGAALVVRETEPSLSAYWHECCESVRRLLVQMAPIGPRHQSIVDQLTEEFSAQNKGRYKVSPGRPIPIPDFNEPQPDMVLFKRGVTDPRRQI